MIEPRQHGSGIYLGLLIIILVVVIQGTLLARLRFFGASPNLLLVVTICWSMLSSVSDGLLWAFAGGLGVDLIAGTPLGTTPLALMPACFLAGLGRSRVFSTAAPLPLVLVALATLIFGGINLLLMQVRHVPVAVGNTMMRVVLPELALNVLLTAVIYPFLRWVATHVGTAKMEW